MNTLRLTVTPEALAQAGPYGSPCNCLIATMFKNYGFKEPRVANDVHILNEDGIRIDIYEPDKSIGCESICMMNGKYRPELVGEVFVFTRKGKG